MLLKSLFTWIGMGIGGVVLAFIGAFYFGNAIAGMFAMFGSFIAVMPVFMIISKASARRFLPLFETLKDNQKFVHYPDKFGKLGTMIVDIKHTGILFKKGYGIIDDKGTEYAWGKEPTSFIEPECGITIDVPTAQYMNLLKKQNKLVDYEQMIKEYLGENEYRKFCERFRINPKPDWMDIEEELEYIKNFKPTADKEGKFRKIVFGTSWGMNNYMAFLKYALNPLRVDTAIKTEVLLAKQEAAGYKDQSKALAWGKAILLILMGLAIFFAIMSALNLGNIGQLFGFGGGGGGTVPPTP